MHWAAALNYLQKIQRPACGAAFARAPVQLFAPQRLNLPFLFRLLCLFCLLYLAQFAYPAKAAPPPSETGLALYKSLLPQALAGNAEIQTQIGLMRLQGDVVPRELKTARVWLGKAAIQNHTPAQFYLGQLLLLDVFNARQADLNKQLTEGLGWLRRAARNQHNPSQLLYAQTMLQSQMENPFGHSKMEAQQHLNSCANTHIPCALFALRRLDQANADANCSRTDSCEQMRGLLYTLANAEDPNARYRLSKLDGEDSLFWLRRAARLNHPQASHELAGLVLNNEVQLQAEDPAVLSLLNTAAQQGVVDAMYLLGSLLHEGTRFPVNKQLGLQWLDRAADQGHQPSVQLLSELRAPPNSNATSDKVKSALTTESTP